MIYITSFPHTLPDFLWAVGNFFQHWGTSIENCGRQMWWDFFLNVMWVFCSWEILKWILSQYHIYQFKTISLFWLFNLEKMSILPGVSSLYWSWHWCNMEPGRGSQLCCSSSGMGVGAVHRAGSGFLSGSSRIPRWMEWWEWNLWERLT